MKILANLNPVIRKHLLISALALASGLFSSPLLGKEENEIRGAPYKTDPALAEQQFQTGKNLFFGKGIAVDKAEACKWLGKSAEQGHPRAQYLLATSYESGDGIPQDDLKAFQLYSLSAEQGHAFAQLSLGQKFLYGESTAKDSERAFIWFVKSAEQGNAFAQNRVGECYRDGSGIGKDFTKAAHWFEKAALQGNIYAQVSLGIAYSEGKEVKKDLQESRRWFKMALDQDDAWALFAIGKFYFTHSDEYNQSEGLFYAMKSAEKGYISGEYLTAMFHIKGFIQIHPGAPGENNKIANLPVDKKRAFTLLLSITNPEKFKKFNDEDEFTENGLYYLLASTAMDVRAYDTAFEFFSKSADLNDSDAIHSLGYCYEKGYGCKANMNIAIEKYAAARDAGNKDAAQRLFDIEHPEVFIECAYCRGSGRVPETTVSYKNCPECGGRRGKTIRR